MLVVRRQLMTLINAEVTISAGQCERAFMTCTQALCARAEPYRRELRQYSSGVRCADRAARRPRSSPHLFSTSTGSDRFVSFFTFTSAISSASCLRGAVTKLACELIL